MLGNVATALPLEHFSPCFTTVGRVGMKIQPVSSLSLPSFRSSLRLSSVPFFHLFNLFTLLYFFAFARRTCPQVHLTYGTTRVQNYKPLHHVLRGSTQTFSTR